MKRVSGLGLIFAIIAVFALTGCEDDSQSAEETGFELVIEDCLSFGVYVFIDGELQDFASTDEPHFFPLPSGTYDLYAYGNAVIEGYYYCWTTQVTVPDGAPSRLVLECSEETQCEQ